MKTIPRSLKITFLFLTVLFAGALILTFFGAASSAPTSFDQIIKDNSKSMMEEGREAFRFDTFGDEVFWGDTLQLHQAIQGANFGGVGGGLSPATALLLGLKVDVDKLSPKIVDQLKNNQVNLNDPGVTLLLLKRNAVVGLTGFLTQTDPFVPLAFRAPCATRQWIIP
jgi:hypothetical protein